MAQKIGGFLVGFLVPALVAFGVFVTGYPNPYTSRIAFFGCLASALVLTVASGYGWANRKPFWHGVTFGAGVWLLILPAMWGDCTKVAWAG